VARWQYAIVSRYGALLLILVGLGMIATAMAGVTAVSPNALLPSGLGAVVSGVVLPRVKGRFTGPGKIGADLLGLDEVDTPLYRYSAPTVAPPEQVMRVASDTAQFSEEAVVRVITVRDVVRGLLKSPDVVSILHEDGHTTYEGPDGGELELVAFSGQSNHDNMSRPADGTLLDIAQRWGVEINATGVAES